MSLTGVIPRHFLVFGYVKNLHDVVYAVPFIARGSDRKGNVWHSSRKKLVVCTSRQHTSKG
jgi:hypothetical protein